MSRAIRRSSRMIIHRGPRVRPRGVKPLRPWYEPAPKRGRPRNSELPADPRGTSSERGYGAAHKRERERWSRIIAAGGATCVRCGQPIAPGEPWHLDHADVPGAHQFGWYLGPAHKRCNINAGKKSNGNNDRVSHQKSSGDSPQPQQTKKPAPAVAKFFRLNVFNNDEPSGD